MLRFTLIFVLSLLFVSPLLSQTQDSCACCTPAHEQFAFWLGDWEVTRADNGQAAGTNHIVSMQDQCLMQENWKSAKGSFTGSSYNYYNSIKKVWNQVWVDNSGFVLEMSGNWVKDAMVLSTGHVKNNKGETVIHRVIWTPKEDASVVQHWEMSKDFGQSWSTLFKGIYKKKKD